MCRQKQRLYVCRTIRYSTWLRALWSASPVWEIEQDYHGYGVETKRINEAVKNNPDKFPDDFYFELDVNEQDFLRSKFSTLKKGRGQHSKYSPKAFNEQGVYMLATILKSPIAEKLSHLDGKVSEHDEVLNTVFKPCPNLSMSRKQRRLKD